MPILESNAGCFTEKKKNKHNTSPRKAFRGLAAHDSELPPRAPRLSARVFLQHAGAPSATGPDGFLSSAKRSRFWVPYPKGHDPV